MAKIALNSVIAPVSTEKSVVQPATLTRHISDIGIALQSNAQNVVRVSAAVEAAANGVGLYAARPASAQAGVRYLATDAGSEFVYDGSTWRPIVKGVTGYEPIPNNLFGVWQKWGTAPKTSSLVGGSPYIYRDSAGGNDLSGYYKPKTSRQSMTCHLIGQYAPLSNTTSATAAYGAYVGNVASGKRTGIYIGVNGSTANQTSLNVYNFTNGGFTSEAAATYKGLMMPGVKDIWIRIVDTGFSLTYSFSYDGINFLLLFTDTTTFLGAGNYGDHFGFGIDPSGSGVGVTCDSFVVH